jgi:hypothetical protein
MLRKLAEDLIAELQEESDSEYPITSDRGTAEHSQRTQIPVSPVTSPLYLSLRRLNSHPRPSRRQKRRAERVMTKIRKMWAARTEMMAREVVVLQQRCRFGLAESKAAK